LITASGCCRPCRCHRASHQSPRRRDKLTIFKSMNGCKCSSTRKTQRSLKMASSLRPSTISLSKRRCGSAYSVWKKCMLTKIGSHVVFPNFSSMMKMDAKPSVKIELKYFSTNLLILCSKFIRMARRSTKTFWLSSFVTKTWVV
jgi:hypothetical protein